MIDKAFISKIEQDENSIEEKAEEKFKNDQEIQNIINELYIKQKNSEYLFNKQRQTLKKFNIQEKIQREESKIITDNEESQKNEIFSDAIQKLAARHLLGFEPLMIIRQKILSKIQNKYNIDKENMDQLTEYFESNSENDKEIEIKRKEKQIEVLDKLLSDNKKFNYSDVDKGTVIKVKNEIKKYEKDLELKASQIEAVDKLDELNIINKDIEDINMMKTKDEEYFDNMDNEDDDDFKIKITDILDKQEITPEEFQNNLKNEILKEIDNNINIDDNKNECNIDEYNEFSSKILNNLAWKMKYKKKLSDFDNQILLYITHSIIDELNCAKKNKRDFNFLIPAQDLMKFLKEFKIEKKKDNFTSSNDLV